MMKISKVKWIKFGFWTVIYVLFCIWIQSWLMLLGVLVITDIFLTRIIPWGGWKRAKNPGVRKTLELVDDLLFALIFVYIINLFLFQNYQIPTPSLEKSLLVGDYLFVSKVSYGPRIPNTPISFPLVQNTLPFINSKSYIEWPRWGYKRAPGFGTVKRNNIVVFNFPAGDTIALNMQNPDYYSLLHDYGREAIHLNKAAFGEVMYRPVDKRENYVKRCIGMPGDSLSVVNNQVVINGEEIENPEGIQLNYFVETDGSFITPEQFRQMGISRSDQRIAGQNVVALLFQPDAAGRFNPVYHLPLTKKTLNYLQNLATIRRIIVEPDGLFSSYTYPLNYPTGWTRDNYGPIWIPSKGATIELTPLNLALYHRCIRNYENNNLDIDANGKVFINGKETTTYTFGMDYYFMMGDNRHNSADSRSWGFVPEDHIVGKPIMVWMSFNKDHGLLNGGIRWNRIFRMVDTL
jgi:signal peptidase I